jgi:hypothetical protein
LLSCALHNHLQEQELKSSVSRMGMQLATVNSELQTALASLTKEQDASMKAKYIANAAEVCCCSLTKYSM